jgi:hypothetical protein
MLITKRIGGNFTYVEIRWNRIVIGQHKCLMENARGNGWMLVLEKSDMHHNNSKTCELLDIGKPGTQCIVKRQGVRKLS